LTVGVSPIEELAAVFTDYEGKAGYAVLGKEKKKKERGFSVQRVTVTTTLHTCNTSLSSTSLKHLNKFGASISKKLAPSPCPLSVVVEAAARTIALTNSMADPEICD
jgi:hypothetical protein